MLDFTYSYETKTKCWYNSICDKSKCGTNFCIRHYKMSSLIYMAGMQGKECYPVPLKLDKDAIDKDAFSSLKNIQNNVNDFINKGNNLLIYSKYTGNGKTEWSKKLLLSWFDTIWPTTDFTCRGLFISVPRLLRSYVENISKTNDYFQYINENIFNADVVVWDELNSKDYTEFEHNYLLSVISHRISIGKSNIFTTNYDLNDIERKLGTRLSSRIIGSSVKIEFKGKDKRSWGVE